MTPIDYIVNILPPLAFAPPPPGEGSVGTWGALLFFVAIALGISFICSVLEAILLSTSHAHIELAIEKGGRGGTLMQKHKADVERPISAILTLNTVAHTVGAAGAGAEAVGIFGNQWFGVISAVLTILILVFSEIIPKTLGATYWKQLNSFAAYTIEGLVWVLFPAVWILEKATQVLKSEDNQPIVSRVELEVMARIGVSEGSLHEYENRILRNLLLLEKIRVSDIMTPRTVTLAFQQEMTIGELFEKHPALPYSRLPIYDNNTDDVTGFVLRIDVLTAHIAGEIEKPLIAFRRDIGDIPETNSVASALDEFITKQQHILLVIDEYGGTAGVLTMEDTLESLLGIEITDESDVVEDLRKMAEQRYKRQQALLERMNKAKLSIPNPPETPTSSD
ncbi:MAG: CNNM domain-containing protein [Anaerolineae bacterium]|nr:CNNM domain-containing protein [Anaerolineae bacterium]MDQ7036575.1 CNNM domain-containing protein [Anaerolineae bacterium]